jgi:hypothetical protein
LARAKRTAWVGPCPIRKRRGRESGRSGHDLLVAEHVRGGRTYHRGWVERTFAPQLAGLRGPARKRRIAALVAATDVYTWKLLRLDLGLSQAETERTLVEMIG